MSHSDFAHGQREEKVVETLVIPVVEESATIATRVLETGKTRIHKSVTEREQILEEAVLHDEVTVDRVAVNRVVDGPVPVRYEGDVMIIPLMEEILVVEKRLMLKEELHISRRQITVREPQKVTLRSEEVIIDHIDLPISLADHAADVS